MADDVRNTYSPVAGIQQLRRGDHACLLYKSDDEFVIGCANLTHDGLVRNHKIQLVASELAPDELAQYLGERIPGWVSAVDAGQIDIVSAVEAYLPHGTFDLDRRVQDIVEANGRAKKDGYTGLRIITDMSWAASGRAGIERAMPYEAVIGPVVVDQLLAVACLYDRRRFDADELDRAAAVHPARPEQALLAGERISPTSLRLSGQVDASNHADLAGLVQPLVQVAERVRIDATELVFTDVATARLLIKLAISRAPHATVIAAVEPLAGLMQALGAPAVAGLTIYDVTGWD